MKIFLRKSSRSVSVACLGALLLGIVIPLCEAAEDPRHFTIAASAQSPPFSFLDKHNRPQGILIDFWNLWAVKTGARITFKMGSFDKTIEWVRDGAADFHAGIFQSEQRMQYLDFSPGFLNDTLSLFVLDKLNIRSILDMKAVPVAVGVSREYYAVEYMKEHFPFIKTKLYTNNEELLHSTIQREIVAFVVDYPVAFHYLSENDALGQYRVVEDISNQKLRAAVRKGNGQTLAFIDAGLKKISELERDQLSDKWGLREQSTLPAWLFKTMIMGGVAVLLLGFFIHWVFLRREVRKQIRDLEEKNRLLTLMQRDMMEVNKAQQSLMEDLEKVSRDNLQMLDIITRDMKTSMETIYKAAQNKEGADDVLEAIRSQSAKVLSLIDQFRQIPPAEAENFSREMKKTDLTAFFVKKKKDFQNLASLNGMDVIMDVPAEPISSMIHLEYFDQLVNNIFLSTLKYSVPGRKIHVALKHEGADDDKKIIMQFHYQSLAQTAAKGSEILESSDPAHFPVESATGIRLALVQKLIHLLGGNIYTEVKDEGERTIILELPLLKEIAKNYEDIEALLQTGDIILFKGLYYNRLGEKVVASDWTHVGMIVRMPGYAIPLIWESTPLENVPDLELRSKKSGALLVSLRERLENYETDVYAIRFLKVIRDASMLNNLFSFIYHAHTLPFPSELRVVGKIIQAKIFSRLYRLRRRYKNIFCSELVAESYIQMGLLPDVPPPSAYMPVDFSSRNRLHMLKGAHLSSEFMIKIPRPARR